VNPSTRTLIITLVTWALLTVYVPMQWMPPRALAILTLLPQVTMMAMPFVLWMRLRSATSSLSSDLPRLQPSTA